MFTINDVSKRFGDALLFEHVSFSINPGDRIGLVGPNGSGKSTLLQILTGEDRLDSGAISLAPRSTIGCLRQGFADLSHGTLGDLIDLPANGLIAAHERLERSTNALGDPGVDPDTAAGAFQAASDHFDACGGYSA